MKRDIQYKQRQLKVIITGWLLIALLFTVYDQLMLLSGDAVGPSASYAFGLSLAKNCAAGFIGSLAGGSLLVFYINVRYQHKPYSVTLLLVCVWFVIIWAVIVLLIGLVTVYNTTDLLPTNAGFIPQLQHYLHDSTHIKAAMQWISVLAITQLLLQVNSKFGQNLFWNILRGRYHTPRQEKKIFMFLDINASTTIAEKLGDEAYHAFLKDFFADISFAILDNKGFIYQYVGDEAVIAWNYDDGIHNMQCVKCFFDMKAAIQKEKDKYLSRYGIAPSFKAGMHSGSVIGGEIGIMKRDITYSGDVLNTAARIVGKAGELKEELVTSTGLLAEMRSLNQYIARSLGTVQLKGKSGEIALSALQLV